MSTASQRNNDLVDSYLQTVLTGQSSALVDRALRPPSRTHPLSAPAATPIFHRLLNTLTIFAIIVLVLAGMVVLWLPKHQFTPTQFFPSSFSSQDETEQDIFHFPCHLQASSPEHHQPLSDLLPRIAADHPTVTTAFFQSRNDTHNAFAASSSHQATLNSALLDLTSRVHKQLHNNKHDTTHHHPEINQSSILQSLHSIILPSSSSSSSSSATTLNNHTQLLLTTITAIETTIHQAYTVKSSIADGRHDLLNGSGWFEMPGYMTRVWGKAQKKKKKKNSEAEDEKEEKTEQVTRQESRPQQQGRLTPQEQELELLEGYDEAAQELAVLIRDLGQGMQCLKGEVERVEALARGLEDVVFAAAAPADTASSGNMAKDEAAVGMMDQEHLRKLERGLTTTTSITSIAGGSGDDAHVNNNGDATAATRRDALILAAAAEQSFLQVMKQAIGDEERIEQFLALYNRL